VYQEQQGWEVICLIQKPRGAQIVIFGNMLSESLREKTLSSHRELEKQVIQKIKSIQSVVDYMDLLHIFHKYFGNLENKIAPFLHTNFMPDIHKYRHARRLADDIAELGGKPNIRADQVVLPRICSWQDALGALYVMEGSTLGGKFIVQLVSKQAKLTKGFSFFSAYGERTAEHWAQFQDTINARVVEPSDIDQTVTAAGETFCYFSAFIKQYG